MPGLRPFLHRFARDDSGAALVEFALVLPVMLLFFALCIESGRTFWAYQAAIAGVRDATRYVGRTAPVDVCANGGNIDGYQDRVTKIVRETSDGRAIFPSSVTIDRVVPTLTCYGGNYHLALTPVATVTADMTITYPFAGIFGYFGVELPAARTSVADTGRVFGT